MLNMKKYNMISKKYYVYFPIDILDVVQNAE